MVLYLELTCGSTHACTVCSCKELTTVGLHGNEVPDLAPCIAVLQGLPNLQELELDGNPASSHPSYRNVCIGGLDGLRILDGDVVLPKVNPLPISLLPFPPPLIIPSPHPPPFTFLPLLLLPLLPL